jgi:hypothetical protein
MRQRTFTLAGLAAFALTLVSFVLLGFGRLVLPYRTARYLSAPTLFLAFALVLGLLGYSTLVVLGVADLD